MSFFFFRTFVEALMMTKILTLFICFFFFLGLPFITGTPQRSSVNTTISFPVGVVLDLETWVGKMANSCITMALLDFYATHSHYKTRLVLHSRDSKKSIVGAALEALYLLNDVQVEALIGPQESTQAEFIVEVGGKTQVPVMSFTATNPTLSSSTPYFIRMVPNDRYQVKAIAAIIQAFEWKEVVLIYEDTDYGNGIIPHLLDSFQDIDVRINRIAIVPSATEDQILKELNELTMMRNRVFIVHMTSPLGPRFFLTVNDAGMMTEGYVWIITDELANLLDSMDHSVINSMQGVLGVKAYVPRSSELDSFRVKWKRKFRQDYPDIENVDLTVYGLFAYDTVWALAMAAEKVGATNLRNGNTNTSKTKTAHLSDLGISQHGPELLQEILGTKFKGLSGEVRLVDGQLERLVFQILNVIGKGERQIGFWTSLHGITRELNVNGKKTYSTSKDELRTIIWPGEPKTVPKGWVVPMIGKELRIGLAMKDGFSEFVKVERDPRTNETKISGYCIEVFNLVMEALPISIPYKFVPYGKADGETAGYDDLIHQITQKIDAVVGDVSITVDRSSFVDFSLPYTAGGVSMIVPIKYDDRNNMWILFKPMSWELWLTCTVCGILTVLWICIIEAGTELNSCTHCRQIANMIWEKFLRVIFGEGERVKMSSRFILITLVLETLFLNQAYFATLPSVLVDQETTVRDVKDLIERGELVGYQKGSYVVRHLKKLNLDESKLRAYNSLEEYNEALMKGSRNGGVAAIYDEIPYIKLFLKKYHGKYTVVGPTYWMDGFAFVFPRGSPLVGHVSRAILSIIEGEKMAEIENKIFGPQTSRPAPDSSIPNSSSQLSLSIFRGFFLFTSIIKLTSFLAYRRWCTNNSDTAVVGPAINPPNTASSDVGKDASTEHNHQDQNLPITVED